MIFKPRPYQKIMVDHIAKHPRCGLWVPMGMGKTSASLCVVDALRYIDGGSALAIAPLRVATSVWTDEINKWKNFKNIKCIPIIGDAEERLERLDTPADLHTINYENLPWLKDHLGTTRPCPWGTIIADEATRLKSFRLGGKKGKRAKALARFAFNNVERFIELTGTPSPNGLKDLWGQLWFLDGGKRLGRTYTSFINRWFVYGRDGFSISPLPHAFDEIMGRVKDICMSLNVHDWFDIKEPIIIDVPVKLHPQAMKLYKRMEREMYIEIEKEGIEAFNAAVRSIKTLQIANGFIFREDKTWIGLHDAKLDALESVIEEAAGSPILCVYHFKPDLARLRKRFPKGVELGKSARTIDRWNKGKIPLLFVHPASAGHGLNLQHGGNIIVFYSHWWDLEQYLQVIERIGPVRQLQAGFNRPVYIYNIRAVGTIDDLVIRSRTDKRSVQDTLLREARRRK